MRRQETGCSREFISHLWKNDGVMQREVKQHRKKEENKKAMVPEEPPLEEQGKEANGELVQRHVAASCHASRKKGMQNGTIPSLDLAGCTNANFPGMWP